MDIAGMLKKLFSTSTEGPIAKTDLGYEYMVIPEPPVQSGASGSTTHFEMPEVRIQSNLPISEQRRVLRHEQEHVNQQNATGGMEGREGDYDPNSVYDFVRQYFPRDDAAFMRYYMNPIEGAARQAASPGPAGGHEPLALAVLNTAINRAKGMSPEDAALAAMESMNRSMDRQFEMMPLKSKLRR